MEFSPLDLNIMLILCTLSNASPESTRILQLYNGTLTEITCSATVPVFNLIRQGMEYGPEDYTQLPDLFDIEATASPNGENVTLFVNGTNRSDNVTVVCRDFSNAAFGQIGTLFTFILEFVSILPAPSYIEYNNQSTKIMWKPPTLLSDELSSQNVSIDSRITHYILSFTTEDSVTINHTSSETSFSIELNKLPCNLSFQVAAVNPVGVGEFSSPKFVEWCMDFTSSSTPARNLSAGGIAGIVVVCAVVAMTIIASVLTAVFVKYNNGKKKQETKNTDVEITRYPNRSEDTPQNKQMHSGYGSSGASTSDAEYVKDKMQQSATVQKKYTKGSPLVYTEVVTKRQNQVEEPSSVEKLPYAALEHPNQINTES